MKSMTLKRMLSFILSMGILLGLFSGVAVSAEENTV